MKFKLPFFKKKSDEDEDEDFEDAAEAPEPYPEPQPWDELKVPPQIRVLAWWEGYDDAAEFYYLWLQLKEYRDAVKAREEAKRRAAAGEEVDEEEEEDLSDLDLDEEAGRWPPERIKLNFSLWGEEMLHPGGLQYGLDLVKPLGLDETMSMLELGGGLGGVARQYASKFGVWVTSYERDQELALLAADYTARAGGVGKKAPVEHYDPEAPQLRENYYNRVFSHLELWTVEDKETLLTQVRASLREHGEILFTDYCATEDIGSDTYMEWLEKEDFTPQPWLAQKYLEFLGKTLRFDFRIKKNESEEHIKQILIGWQAQAKAMQKGNLDPDTMSIMEAEMEMWMRRVKLLQAGEIAYYRFHAQAK